MNHGAGWDADERVTRLSHVEDRDRQGVVDSGELSTGCGDRGDHVLRSQMVAESFEIDLMRLERAHAAIDMVGAQRHGMGGLAAVYQQMAGLPRLQALVSEFSENPRVVGVADSVDGGDAGIAMIDVV